MGRSRKEIVENFPKVQEMYNNGMTTEEIAEAFNVSKSSVWNWFNIMGITMKKRLIEETNLVYAVHTPPVLEKVTINGKIYTDITPLFSPR